LLLAVWAVLQLAQRRQIDPLAPVDHSLIEYDDFAKDFYTEHPSITAMTDEQVVGCGARWSPGGRGGGSVNGCKPVSATSS